MTRLTGSTRVKVIILMAVTLLFLYMPGGVEGASYDPLFSLSSRSDGEQTGVADT